MPKRFSSLTSPYTQGSPSTGLSSPPASPSTAVGNTKSATDNDESLPALTPSGEFTPETTKPTRTRSTRIADAKAAKTTAAAASKVGKRTARPSSEAKPSKSTSGTAKISTKKATSTHASGGRSKKAILAEIVIQKGLAAAFVDIEGTMKAAETDKEYVRTQFTGGRGGRAGNVHRALLEVVKKLE